MADGPVPAVRSTTVSTPRAQPLACPTGQVVRDALPPDGTLLDVGCGDGWFSAPFAADHRVVGVEEDPVLAERARAAGVAVVQRPWPDCADEVEPCDVAAALHAGCGGDVLARFVAALHAHGRRAVVVELATADPALEDLLAAVRSITGRRPAVEVWRRPGSRYQDLAGLLEEADKRSPADRATRDELREALGSAYTVDLDGAVLTAPVEVATVWWAT